MKNVLLIITAVILLTGCCAKKKSADPSTAKLKECPDEWIENKMPSTEARTSNEYFIYKGERRELTDFDLEWVKKNCDVKKQTVY